MIGEGARGDGGGGDFLKSAQQAISSSSVASLHRSDDASSSPEMIDRYLSVPHECGVHVWLRTHGGMAASGAMWHATLDQGGLCGSEDVQRLS